MNINKIIKQIKNSMPCLFYYRYGGYAIKQMANIHKAEYEIERFINIINPDGEYKSKQIQNKIHKRAKEIATTTPKSYESALYMALDEYKEGLI